MKFKVFDKIRKEFINETAYFIDSDGEVYNAVDDEYCPNLEAIFSTGLKDKNGKEYEDGSVFIVGGKKRVIFWNKEYAAFMFRTKEESPNIGNFLDLLSMHNKEIIGSSLTNPELLEK